MAMDRKVVVYGIYYELKQRGLCTSMRNFCTRWLCRSVNYWWVAKTPSGKAVFALYDCLKQAGQHDLADKAYIAAIECLAAESET